MSSALSTAASPRTKSSRARSRSTKQDPYPIGQRLFMLNERLTDMIVRNLHQRITQKKEAAGPA